jgi:hypothetical protein
MYAGPGAVRQHEGKLPIYVCNDCGREVVWATSAKTGRKYLANISHGAQGARFYIGANVHECDRSRTPEAILDREIDAEIKAAEEFALVGIWARFEAALEAQDLEGVTAARAEIAEIVNARNAR